MELRRIEQLDALGNFTAQVLLTVRKTRKRLTIVGRKAMAEQRMPLGYGYVCDPAQRMWVLTRHAVRGCNA